MPLSTKLGLLLFITLVIIFASHYGSHWEFGSYGMPSTLLAPDGVHYRDGSEVDPFTLAVARSGYEQEAYACALVILGGLFLAGGVLIWRCHRMHRAILDEARRRHERS